MKKIGIDVKVEDLVRKDLISAQIMHKLTAKMIQFVINCNRITVDKYLKMDINTKNVILDVFRTLVVSENKYLNEFIQMDPKGPFISSKQSIESVHASSPHVIYL